MLEDTVVDEIEFQLLDVAIDLKGALKIARNLHRISHDSVYYLCRAYVDLITFTETGVEAGRSVQTDDAGVYAFHGATAGVGVVRARVNPFAIEEGLSTDIFADVEVIANSETRYDLNFVTPGIISGHVVNPPDAVDNFVRVCWGDLDFSDLAAWVVVAQVILQLDEVWTRP